MSFFRAYRFRPARVVSLVLLMIVFGSAARAEVLHLTLHSSPAYRFSPALVSSLALPPRDVARESGRLRVVLFRERRQATAVERERRSWKAPAATVAPVATVVSHSGANWYAIAACESGGVWAINSGNGFWGGLQFSPGTWYAYGGGPFDGTGPFPYSAGQQIAVAERVLAAQGPSAWPNCFRWA